MEVKLLEDADEDLQFWIKTGNKIHSKENQSIINFNSRNTFFRHWKTRTFKTSFNRFME